MSLNRLMMGKNPSSSGGGGTTGDNEILLTVGELSYQYGYSRYNGSNYGDIQGDLYCDGKLVTLGMLVVNYGWLDLLFTVEGVNSGSYSNVVVQATDESSGLSSSVTFSKISYQGYMSGFYESANTIPAEFIKLFAKVNVGKTYRVKITFNKE